MMKLTGTHYAYARRRQSIVIDAADFGKRHALRVVVDRGGVSGVGFRLGTAAGAQDIVYERALGTGEHIMSFVPVSSPVHLELNHVGYDPAYVSSCEKVAAGDLELTNGFGRDLLSKLRYDQSGDVMFIGARGEKQRKLIRWDDYSWSLVKYEPIDGPFRKINATSITITPSALNGEITLAASKDLFRAEHVGALFKLDSVAQQTSDVVAGAAQFGSSVRVTGVTTSRNLTINTTGVWVGTLTLQRSIGEPGSWVDVTTYVANQVNTVYNDGLDNEIAHYRIGFKAGEYTSGAATVALSYASGSNTGVVEITAVSSGTAAAATVIEDLGSTNATEDWYEGRWSPLRGYPDVPVLHDGRLYWLGKDRLTGSISDEFESLDSEVTGDSGLIDRSIGSGPVDTIAWGISLTRLTVGGFGKVYTARASSLDEPLTPTEFGLKGTSSQGSADIPALEIDEGAVFVQRSTKRLFEIAPDENFLRNIATDLSALAPDLCKVGIVAIGVQYQPETRVHCVLADGSVAVLVYDKLEKVKAWFTVGMHAATDVIVDVTVLPGDGREDHVYYTVGSDGEYHLTKWAQEDECQGEELNLLADFYVSYTGAAIDNIDTPAVLDGRECVVWADGAQRANATPVAGSVTLDGDYENIVVGLYYRARYRSAKLAHAAGYGSALTQPKNLGPLGLILYNTHKDGVKYGRNFTKLDALPGTSRGAPVAADTIHADYDDKSFAMQGLWDTDARLCLQSEAPKPATIVAAVIGVETHDRT